MNSIWINDYIDYSIPKINKNLETPILIIGGGLAGLMCAYNLMKNKISFILVDGKKLARGVSANTTAQINVAHASLFDEIIKKHGKDKARKYLKSQIEGQLLMKQIITNEKIKCDYKEESTIISTNEEKKYKNLINQFNYYKDYLNCKIINNNQDFINYKKAIKLDNQFIINPMKYMMGIINILIKNKCFLYENSQVTKINKNKMDYEVIINNKYKINTPKIIMACHYPILNPDNLYFTKIYQSKSYVVAFKTKLKLNANYVSLDSPYYYFRTYDKDTLLIGGCDHFTGANKNIETCYETLINKIYDLDPHANILNKWFTEDCITLDSLPLLGKYSYKNPNIILVTGFNKWGFTNSHIAAKKIADMIINKKYNSIYSPQRLILFKNLIGTLRMITHSINGLIISKIFIRKYKLSAIKIGEGKCLRLDNNNVLVYRESNNKYIFLKNICTHMGCSLIWNNVDKVWESKCHGSIFDKYGHVIYGPAIKDLEKYEFK